MWLTYRTFALKRPLRLTWPLLYRQFGVNPARATDQGTVDNFRRDCLRELQKIKTLVAGPALPNGQRGAAALAITAVYRSVATAPRGIADCRSVTSRVWAPARRRTPIPRQTMRQHDGKRSLLKP